MQPHELTLQARYVFPVDGPPVAAGSVRIAGDRITHVGPADRQPDLDLGNAAIVPGFVNAHTHLELSNIRAKSVSGDGFVDWLRRVIQARAEQKSAELTHAIERGIDASLAAGTTLVGDISTGGRSWRPLIRSPLRAVVFCELLGLRPARAVETAHAARQFLGWARDSAGAAPPTESADATSAVEGFVFRDGTSIEPFPAADRSLASRRISPSLSPHAPYSTHPLLYDLASHWAGPVRVPLSTHLAETREEIRLLEHRDGPLRDFLVSIGAWDDDWSPVGLNPVDSVESTMARDADWLIAHGNYLSDAAIQQLASRSREGPYRRTIAYCPRTHAYFGHAPHPYTKLHAAGVAVCLGTDSLASTPTLSVLDEMRFLHGRDAKLSGPVLLEMATLAGARALGRDGTCGSLTPGKFADLAVIRLPDRDDQDPHRLILESDHPALKTMIGGRFVFQFR